MVMAARLSVHRTQARDLTTVRNTPPETLKWLGSHSWEPFFHLWADPIVSATEILANSTPPSVGFPTIIYHIAGAFAIRGE
jgi:hypothetical protein